MHLDVRETVNVVLRAWPGASHVLRRHGLDDFLWWGGTPLDEACRAQGIDVAAVAAEIVRQADPDVAHAFRAKPGGPASPAPAPTPAPTPTHAPAPAPAPARAQVDPGDGLPDVAQVFHARAGTPHRPFLRAQRPPPEPEPQPQPQPQPQLQPAAAHEPPRPAPAAALPPAGRAPRPTPPPPPAAPPAAPPVETPTSPERAALIARRKELQDELEQLKALRDQTRRSGGG